MAVHPDQSADFVAFVTALTDDVRALSTKWFRHSLEIHTKLDASPVTIADREVEATLRQRIAEQYPQHGLLGEEMGNSDTDAEYVWVIDPIDGTSSFISGHPLWGTLIALLHNGVPILGIIDVPMMNERWTGGTHLPTRLNGAHCRTSSCQRLDQACLYATSPDIFNNNDMAAFERLSQSVRMRRFGGDCYSYALLASGHIDLVMEASLQPYDYLALVPVIENAGGKITDWNGKALHMHSDGRVLAAANSQLHEQTLATIATARRTDTE